MKCSNPDHGHYPNYGMAPRRHDMGAGTFIGSTRILPKAAWPPYFVEDEDSPGAGTWYCPTCFVPEPPATEEVPDQPSQPEET